MALCSHVRCHPIAHKSNCVNRHNLATVYKWRAEARAAGHSLPAASAQGSQDWSSKDRFAAVLAAAAMNAEQTAEYCPCRGLYPEQLAAWRSDCEQAGNHLQQARRRRAEEANLLRARIRELERELTRKNAALAETAALLTLSKKQRRSGGTRRDDQRHR